MEQKLVKGHQGDVQFKEIKKIPSKTKHIKNKPLAYGEFSGHTHVLTGDVELYERDETIYAVVGNYGARLQHIHESNLLESSWKSNKELPIADHRSHLLPKGIYEFWIQKAYNPFTEAMERVMD